MTEQKLSLDEMIELAKVFSNGGKWRFGKTRNSKYFQGFIETDKLDGMYMVFWCSSDEVYLKYSLHLLTNGRDDKDEIEVENYFVEIRDYATKASDITEDFNKLSKLYELVKKGAYATQAEEQRQRDAESHLRHVLVVQRKADAIETARKLLGK